MQGYCTLKQDFRTFKLSRISEFEILEDVFITREFEKESLGSSDWIKKKIITIKLVIHESLRERRSLIGLKGYWVSIVSIIV